MKIHLGMKAVLTHRVTESDLATAWKNEVPVMATPILLWLSEVACMQATDLALDPGCMTLGYRHEMAHLAPTPKDWTVTITAELIEADARLLTYSVTAHDGQDTVLSGKHVRAIVDRGRFVSKVESKAASASKES